MREYTTRVRAALAVTELGEGQTGQPALQAIFFPSFHPEVAITVDHSLQGWSVELRTAGTNLHHHSQYQAVLATGAQPGWDPPREPELIVKRATATGEAVSAVARIASKSGLSTWGQGGLGVDGMFLCCMRRSEEGAVEQGVVWLHGGENATAADELANVLYDAAKCLLPDLAVQLALEGLHGYLGRGLPAAVVAHKPTTARIFGGLSVNHEAELTAFLSALPTCDPVLVDMSNFGHMGTVLYPVFRRFVAGRRAATAWLVNDAARDQLVDAGVSEQAMATVRKAALALLA